MNFNYHLNEAMKRKNITGYKIEQDTGIKQTTISAWRTGKSLPTIDKFTILTNYLEMDPRELLGIENLYELPENETQLLENYRRADSRGKEAILETAEREARRQQRDKERSSDLQTG